MERAITEMFLIIAALVAMFIIISISSTLNPLGSSPKEIRGDKDYVSGSIADLIYDCYKNNAGNIEAVICSEINVRSAHNITRDDIFPFIRIKMNASKVKIGPTDLRGKIIIRYENENIYVKQIGGIVE